MFPSPTVQQPRNKWPPSKPSRKLIHSTTKLPPTQARCTDPSTAARSSSPSTGRSTDTSGAAKQCTYDRFSTLTRTYQNHAINGLETPSFPPRAQASYKQNMIDSWRSYFSKKLKPYWRNGNIRIRTGRLLLLAVSRFSFHYRSCWPWLTRCVTKLFLARVEIRKELASAQYRS